MAIHITSLNHRLSSRSPSRTDELHVTEKRWFAVRTSSKHEKRAARELASLGVESYVPLRQKVCHYTRKTVTRELPLLTGYVFVRIILSEELTVRKAHYTAGFVRIGRDRTRVTDEEIELLRVISSDRQLDWQTIEESFAFAHGTPVEIIRGPLSGVRGHYIEKKSKKSFVISFGGLGACLATCEVDPRYLVALTGDSEVGQDTSPRGSR